MTREYPDRPFCGVGIVVLRNDTVLMVRRAKPPRQGLLSLPGGLQELGETIEAAARREVLEETGLQIQLVSFLDVVDSITYDDWNQIRYHYTLCEFAAIAPVGEPIAGDDATDALWIRLDELDDLDLWSETVRIIRLAAEKVGEERFILETKLEPK